MLRTEHESKACGKALSRGQVNRIVIFAMLGIRGFYVN
jgi:hypothetical protein